MKACSLLLALAVSGCGLCPPAREVPLPVPVPCIEAKDMPVAVFVTDAQLATMSDYQIVLALRAHHLHSLGHIGKLEALLLACQ